MQDPQSDDEKKNICFFQIRIQAQVLSEKDRLTQELTLSCGNSMVGGGQLLCIYIYINNSTKQHYTKNPIFFTSFDIYIHIPEVFFFICFFFGVAILGRCVFLNA